jgi:hypothetical protein|tara:strand:+ start:1754 stop:2089 length:336 start_codon:yes stop_codon:yes gene_type:complete
MTMQNNFANPYQDFLEGTNLGRRAAFFSGIPNFGQPASQQQFFTNLFPQFENRYLAALGRQIQSGEAPTLQFQNFVSDNFNPRAELLKAPTYQSGQGTSGLVSPARFLTAF